MGHCKSMRIPIILLGNFYKSIVQWYKHISQGIVDGSTSRPALVQDTNYMVEKTYHIAQYLSAFGAYLMPQWPINGSKNGSIYKNVRWNVVVNSRYLSSGQKTFSFGQKLHRKKKIRKNHFFFILKMKKNLNQI